MKCDLISVGTEILLGDILNSNAQYLSKELANLGIGVMFQCTVGDNAKRLKDTLELAFTRSELVILTGGLGPTPDDLTKEVCAEYFGVELVENKEILKKIEAYFNGKNIKKMPESNKKQALVPKEGQGITLENKNGTAPGCIMEKDGKIIVVLPGPPREMKPMFIHGVKPYLAKFTDAIIKSHSIRTFGIGESAMAEAVGDMLDMVNPTVAPYAKSGEALLRVTAKAKTEDEAEKLMKPVIEEIKNRLGKYVYATDMSSIEEATVALLKEKKLKVTFAESCTAGLCAKRITDIAGASEIFECGIVSYSDEIKHKVLSVDEDLLSKYTAVSEPVAAAMALGAFKISGADFAVAITGMAGPDSPDESKPVGLIYIAVTDGKNLWLKTLKTGHSKGDDCRDYNRLVSASNAINELRLCAECYPNVRSDGKDIEKFIQSF